MLFGRLAQLVEHPLDVREVTGSSPVSSTRKPTCESKSVFLLHKVAKIADIPCFLSMAETG